MDCRCYDAYRTPEAFRKNVIQNRQSYLACIGYEATSRNRLGHCSVPIMLGSYLDFEIRGAEAVKECRVQWGLVILRGVLKIYSSFSTFGEYIMWKSYNRTSAFNRMETCLRVQ